MKKSLSQTLILVITLTFTTISGVSVSEAQKKAPRGRSSSNSRATQARGTSNRYTRTAKPAAVRTTGRHTFTKPQLGKQGGASQQLRRAPQFSSPQFSKKPAVGFKPQPAKKPQLTPHLQFGKGQSLPHGSTGRPSTFKPKRPLPGIATTPVLGRPFVPGTGKPGIADNHRPLPPLTRPLPPVVKPNRPLPPIVKPNHPVPPIVKPNRPLPPIVKPNRPFPPIVKPNPPVRPLPPIVRPPVCYPKPNWCDTRPSACHWWWNYCPQIRYCEPAQCITYACDYVTCPVTLPGGVVVEARWWLGVKGLELPKTGFGIESVEAGSPAANAGLAAGMVITECNGTKIVDGAAMATAIEQSGGVLNLTVLEKIDGEVGQVTIQMQRLTAASF